MRRIAGLVLALLGAFLVTAAIVALILAPGVKKTPLDVDSTTYVTGNGGKLDTATGELRDEPVAAKSVTKSDSEASSDETVVFASYSCVVYGTGPEVPCIENPDDQRTITISQDVFATDRVTALAVPTELESVPHEGLINKWPFDAEQKTYPYWDGVTQQAVDAVFDRTETIRGLETYVYTVNIDDAPIEIAEGVPGTYTDAKEIAVDPVTGSIIRQTESQQRFLENGDPALDLDIAFTEEQVAKNVRDAADSGSSLGLISSTVPLFGFLLGVPLLLGGLFLLRSGSRRRES